MTIKEIIERAAKGDDELYSVVATVNEVDESARTCTCTPIDGGAQLFDVRLQAGTGAETGLVQIPTKESQVVVTFLSKDTAFISLFVEVEKVLLNCEEVTINNGDNGGLVIVQELVNKLNALEEAHNGLVTSFNTHIHNTTATVGPSAVPGVITPTTSQNTDVIAPTTQVVDLENTKVKH
jgi:hypothetical protein